MKNSDIFQTEGYVRCCILGGPGGERIMDVVPGGTELEPQVKTRSWAGRTHSQ
jgi:hypothetical protein